MRQLRKLLRL